MTKEKAPRNKTLSCNEQEIFGLSQSLTRLTRSVAATDLEGAIVNQDLFEAATFLPKSFADLLIIDPPYNISKNFNGHVFKEREKDAYCSWFWSVLDILIPTLRPHRHRLRLLGLEDIHAYWAHLGPRG